MSTHKPLIRFNIVLLSILALVLTVGLTGCGLRGGRNTDAPAVPTSEPAHLPTKTPVPPTVEGQTQPTADQQQAQPTAVPTEAPTTVVEQPDTQGDEIEDLLNALDRQNQQADPLDDVPE